MRNLAEIVRRVPKKERESHQRVRTAINKLVSESVKDKWGDRAELWLMDRGFAVFDFADRYSNARNYGGSIRASLREAWQDTKEGIQSSKEDLRNSKRKLAIVKMLRDGLTSETVGETGCQVSCQFGSDRLKVIATDPHGILTLAGGADTANVTYSLNGQEIISGDHFLITIKRIMNDDFATELVSRATAVQNSGGTPDRAQSLTPEEIVHVFGLMGKIAIAGGEVDGSMADVHARGVSSRS